MLTVLTMLTLLIVLSLMSVLPLFTVLTQLMCPVHWLRAGDRWLGAPQQIPVGSPIIDSSKVALCDLQFSFSFLALDLYQFFS